MCVAGLLLPAALPAGAKSPPNDLKRQVAVLKSRVRRLQAENRSLTQAYAAALRREVVLQRHVAAVDRCRVTHPNGSTPPGPMFCAEPHGNGSIWVGLWHSNVVVWNAQADGSVTTKLGWWRGVPGTLRIEGTGSTRGRP